MANDILAEFSPADIGHFKRDFFQIIKTGAEIDRYFGDAQHSLDSFIPKFEKLVESFNKKYKGLKLRTKKTVENYEVRVLIRERDVKEFFANSASRIAGLKSIGRNSFNQVEMGDAEKFAKFLDTLMDKICISYSEPESGTSTIAAEFDRKEKMIEIVYDPSEITSENSAGFKVCAFYALKEGFNKKIEIYADASTFGFSSLLSETERREWHDRFNPRLLE